MIRLVNVTQHYGVRPVLQSVDLEIDSHGVIAIVGPNGLGKTTLLSVMAGVLSPQRGYVEIDGRKRRGSTEDEIEIRRRVVFLPDRPWLPKQRNGQEYLLAIGALYGVESERLLNHIDRLLELFNLSREGDWPIRSFSNGQQKKLALAGAFITDLGGTLLGVASHSTITIDINAAGHAWFVDLTPNDDDEFSRYSVDGVLRAAPNSPAADQIDLLSVIAHELGHGAGPR